MPLSQKANALNDKLELVMVSVINDYNTSGDPAKTSLVSELGKIKLLMGELIDQVSILEKENISLKVK